MQGPKHIESKDKLAKYLKSCGACAEGVVWLSKHKGSLQDIYKNVPMHLRLWAMARGVSDGDAYCPWEKLTPADWALLLVHRPDLEEVANRFNVWPTITGEIKYKFLKRAPYYGKYYNAIPPKKPEKA
jgi:hypothetical protein